MRRRLFIFLLVLFVLAFYTGYHLLVYTQHSYVLSAIITIVCFGLMFGNLFISRSHPELTEKKWYQIFSGSGSILIGIWGSFLILSIPLDIFTVLSLIFSFDTVFLFLLSVHLYVLPIACAMALFGFIEVLRGPKVKHTLLQRSSVTGDLNGFKIAQISDLHIGMTIRSSYVKKVIKKTNALEADLIVITGDLIDADVPSVQHVIDLLAGFKARYGVYYVPGNHEYYWGIEKILTSLQKIGFHILLNENEILKINQSTLMIAGVTDPAARGLFPAQSPDLAKASATSQKADFKMLLAHQPGIYTKAEKAGYDLQLSGHTHAGQFFPFNIVVSFAHKYSRGLYLYKRMHVYVNSGTGYWGPANRFGIPAEITLIELGQNKL